MIVPYKYFSEIDFDLSKCLFIFSYNDESKINPILKDNITNANEKSSYVMIMIPRLERVEYGERFYSNWRTTY